VPNLKEVYNFRAFVRNRNVFKIRSLQKAGNLSFQEGREEASLVSSAKSGEKHRGGTLK
jgi:hypothetical protein